MLEVPKKKHALRVEMQGTSFPIDLKAGLVLAPTRVTRSLKNSIRTVGHKRQKRAHIIDLHACATAIGSGAVLTKNLGRSTELSYCAIGPEPVELRRSQMGGIRRARLRQNPIRRAFKYALERDGWPWKGPKQKSRLVSANPSYS